MLRRFSSLVALCLGAYLVCAQGGPDDQFIVAYNLIQQAEQSRDARVASHLFEQAHSQLLKIQRSYPSWNERVINYRLRFCSEKLATLREAAAKSPATAPGTNTPAGAVAPVVPAPDAPSGEVLTQFNELNDRIRRLATEKQALEAKLREALSAQPAPIDPRELQAAVEKISALQSTNKTLLTKLETQEADRRNLVDKVVAEEANRALAETRRQLDEQKAAAARLQKERTDVELKLQNIQEDILKPLRFENQTLKTQVVDLRSDVDRGRQVADLSARLTKVQVDLDDLRKRNESLVTEKSALEKQVEDLKARQSEEGIVRIAKLETELAVARADAQRSSLVAEDLVLALSKEKEARTELESENKTLEQRVSQLAARSAADAEALKTLQTALAAERADRTEAEAQLKAAEVRLKSLATPADPTTPVPADAAALVAAARTEVTRLQDSLRQSSQREAELQTALSQESTFRARLQQEKSELERRLADATTALKNRPMAPADPTATRALENRLVKLERERDELQKKLTKLSDQARTRLVSTRSSPATTPRDRAAEFRLVRP
jgi:chromosome segregation ATPase